MSKNSLNKVISKAKDVDIKCRVSALSKTEYIAQVIGVKFDREVMLERGPYISKSIEVQAQGSTFDEAQRNGLAAIVDLMGLEGEE